MAKPAPTKPLRNVIFRLSTEGSARILNFLLTVIGARILGAARWGIYWTGASWAQVATLATDLGGHLTLSRSVARDPRDARGCLGASLFLKLGLSTFVLVIWALAGGFPGLPLGLQSAILGGALCISYIEWLGFHLRGFGRVPAESILLALDCLFAFVAGTLVLVRGGGPLGLAVSQLAAHGTILAAAAAILARSHDFHPRLPTIARLRSFLAESLPTGLYMFASLGSWRLGIIMLAASPAYGAHVAGLFSVAHRIIESARFFPAAVAAALFPSFARLKPEAHPKRILAIALGPVLLGTLLLSLPAVSGWTIRTIFGAAYAPSARMLTVLWWAFPFMTINWVLSHWLIARGHERANSVIALGQMCAHALLLFFLIPSYGAMGASFSLAISEAVFSISAIGFLFFIKKSSA